MRFLLLLPGKLRDAAVRALVDDYATRCRRLNAPLEVAFVREEEERSGDAAAALARETASMLARVPPRFRVVALDPRGRELASEELARLVGDWRDTSVPGMAFLVGSARGLSPDALARADLRLSLSRMTFPHELVLPILAEQLYRSLAILAGLPYHR